MLTEISKETQEGFSDGFCPNAGLASLGTKPQYQLRSGHVHAQLLGLLPMGGAFPFVQLPPCLSGRWEADLGTPLPGKVQKTLLSCDSHGNAGAIGNMHSTSV